MENRIRKAVLVMDMPEHCIDCPCHFAGTSTVVCGVKKEKLLTDDIETYKPDWCPLRELPNPKEKGKAENILEIFSNAGYNACIVELLKGEEG